MSSGANDSGLNEIDLEALRWLAVLEHGPLPRQLQARFEAWVAEDIRHQGALIRAQAAGLRLERLAAFAGGRSVLQPPPQIPERNITRRQVLTAAAAAAVMAGIGVWFGRERVEERWGGTLYTSNVGELKKVTLPDGSVLTMNTQSELRVRYTRERRDVSLTRGEVLFTVAHDPRRPFGVRAGGWTALAVGTEFGVRQLDETTSDITVTAGVVQILSSDRNAADSEPRLVANQRARLSSGGSIAVSRMSASELDTQLAWRSHLVVFSGAPLREALAEMNRYRRKRIAVDDPELARRRIVGVFSTVDSQTFISAMEATLGVKAFETDHVVLLRNVN
jgi:transmembrane sensor